MPGSRPHERRRPCALAGPAEARGTGSATEGENACVLRRVPSSDPRHGQGGASHWPCGSSAPRRGRRRLTCRRGRRVASTNQINGAGSGRRRQSSHRATASRSRPAPSARRVMQWNAARRLPGTHVLHDGIAAAEPVLARSLRSKIRCASGAACAARPDPCPPPGADDAGEPVQLGPPDRLRRRRYPGGAE